MSDIQKQMDYDRERLNAGMDQATWDGLMTMIRYGIERKTILYIAQKVKRIYRPYYFGCQYFEASEEFKKVIPRPRITAEDYRNLRYTENELKGIYELDGYKWGITFIQMAYMMYLLRETIDVEKIAMMFDVDTEVVQEIQDRLQMEKKDIRDYEHWLQLFWEEKLYIAMFQCGFKQGFLVSKRKYVVRLLKELGWTPTMVANIISVPIDVLYQVMESAGIKKKSDLFFIMPGPKESETHDEEKKNTTEVTATPNDNAQEP